MDGRTDPLFAILEIRNSQDGRTDPRIARYINEKTTAYPRFFTIQIQLSCSLDLRGGDESGFALRHSDQLLNEAGEKRVFKIIVDNCYLSVTRLVPVEKISTKLHHLLQRPIMYPLVQYRSFEFILHRGQTEYVIKNLFGGEGSRWPLHFFAKRRGRPI